MADHRAEDLPTVGDAFGEAPCSQCACSGFHAADCPVAPGSLGPGQEEVLRWMRGSDRVKHQAIGVIGTAVVQCADDGVTDVEEVARRINKAFAPAGLWVVNGEELRAFIAGVKAGRETTIDE